MGLNECAWMQELWWWVLEIPKFDLLCYSCFSFHASTTPYRITILCIYIQINLTPFLFFQLKYYSSSSSIASGSSGSGGGAGNIRRQWISMRNRAHWMYIHLILAKEMLFVPFSVSWDLKEDIKCKYNSLSLCCM